MFTYIAEKLQCSGSGRKLPDAVDERAFTESLEAENASLRTEIDKLSKLAAETQTKTQAEAREREKQIAELLDQIKQLQIQCNDNKQNDQQLRNDLNMKEQLIKMLETENAQLKNDLSEKDKIIKKLEADNAQDRESQLTEMRKLESQLAEARDQIQKLQAMLGEGQSQTQAETHDLEMKLAEARDQIQQLMHALSQAEAQGQADRHSLESQLAEAQQHIEDLQAELGTVLAQKPVEAPVSGKDFLQAIREIEGRGNIVVHMKTGAVEFVKPIQFQPRYQTQEPTAELLEPEIVKDVLRDVAELDYLFKVHMLIEGHTQAGRGGSSDWVLRLAENRAQVVVDLLAVLGLDGERMAAKGVPPGTPGSVGHSCVIVRLAIFDDVDTSTLPVEDVSPTELRAKLPASEPSLSQATQRPWQSMPAPGRRSSQAPLTRPAVSVYPGRPSV